MQIGKINLFGFKKRRGWKYLQEVQIEISYYRIKDISNAIYEIADKNFYGVVYDYCGHGVGLDVHEDPSVPNCPFKGLNPRIKPGMVLAIEPMINLGVPDVEILDDGWTVATLDGQVSCHVEHTVAVFEDHTEVLTDLNYKK